MNALEVRNLTKIYKLYDKPSDRLVEIFFKKKKHKIFYANKNISFSLKEGETLGIIGINGAGKSTLLKQIAGVIEPTKGEIIRNGKITALLELGTGFNPEFSGRENIYFNGMLIGMTRKEIEKKEKEIIDFSELGEFIDEPLKTYSSGMSMRLAFSIAIHSNPQIFIVDEALSVGDAHFSAKCTKKLKEMKEKKLSIIYVSHDLNSLKILCDRLLLLNNGELIMEGDVDEVINKYNYLIAKLNKNQENLKIGIKNREFGNFKAKIINAYIEGENSTASVITSGEKAKIILNIEAYENIKNVTIGILIKDKFSQNIFGTNTYYYGKVIDFEKNKKYKIIFEMPMNIGIGKYTLTAAIHTNKDHLENCIHWIDDLIEFEIAGYKDFIFDGIVRLEPSIKILTF